jgi:glycerol-3-phosphate dehydrogenase
VTDPRGDQIEKLKGGVDVLIVGGGINGAGVLRDLALRAASSRSQLRVGLVEQKHFASGTSGKNSQLIHGGLRYLKYLELHLVRESLHERSLLLKLAPQFVKPLQFLLPMYGIKSRVIYGTGLWLYDRLAGSDGIAPHRILKKDELSRLEPGLSKAGLNRSGGVLRRCDPVRAIRSGERGRRSVSWRDCGELCPRHRLGARWSRLESEPCRHVERHAV